MLRTFMDSLGYRLTWARRLALLVLILYIAVFFISSIVIITNANHECIGDGCPICKMIQNAKTLLRGIEKATVSVFAARAALLIIASFTATAFLIYNHSSSLVNTKVRLNK